MNSALFQTLSNQLIELSQNSFTDICEHYATRIEKNDEARIQFLGTGQGSHNISSRGKAQLPSSRLVAGPIVSDGITSVWIDPGPDCLTAISGARIDPRTIDALLVSHAHIDHTGNFLPALEMITGAMELKGQKSVYGNKTAIIGTEDSPSIITRFHAEALKEIRVLEQGDIVQTGTLTIKAIPCDHRETRADNNSINFRIIGRSNFDICFIDGNILKVGEDGTISNQPIDGLIEACEGCNAIILNISNHFHMKRCRQNYPSTFGAAYLIQAVRPRYIFLTHYGIEMQNPNNDELALLRQYNYENIIDFQKDYLQNIADENGILSSIVSTEDFMQVIFQNGKML